MPTLCGGAGRTHRRTRSIEGLGASIDASENFRAELERIGSSGLSGAAKPGGQPAERPALALSLPKAHLLAPNPVSCRSSVGSPLQPPSRTSSNLVPPLTLPPGPSTHQVTLHGLHALCCSSIAYSFLLERSCLCQTHSLCQMQPPLCQYVVMCLLAEVLIMCRSPWLTGALPKSRSSSPGMRSRIRRRYTKPSGHLMAARPL